MDKNAKSAALYKWKPKLQTKLVHRLSSRIYHGLNASSLDRVTSDLKLSLRRSVCCVSSVIPNLYSKIANRRVVYSTTRNHKTKWCVIPTCYAASDLPDNDSPVPAADDKNDYLQLTIKLDDNSKILEVNPLIDTEVTLPPVSEQEIDDYIANETGADRVNDLFHRKIEGNQHPKLSRFEQQTLAIGVMLFIFRGIIGRHDARAKFIAKHKHAEFRNLYSAMKSLSAVGSAAFIRKGLGAFFKSSLFLITFLGTPMVLSSYYNTNSVLHYLAGGVMAGLVFKLPLGPGHAFTGCVMGTSMALIYWPLTYLPVYYGVYPSEEDKHKMYIHEMIAWERYYATVPKKLPLPGEKPKPAPSYDEQGVIPLTDRGRRWRLKIRRFIGLAKPADVVVDESQVLPLQREGRWKRNERGEWVRDDDDDDDGRQADVSDSQEASDDRDADDGDIDESSVHSAADSSMGKRKSTRTQTPSVTS